MAGVKFYYDNNAELKKYFGTYTQGHDWNAAAALTDLDTGGPNDFARTEAGILDTLKNPASAYATTTGVTDGAKFFKLIIDIANDKNQDFTLYILKGIHTKPELHFSVGLAGKIYHLNVKRLGSDNSRFSIRSMSEGTQTWDDPEWKVVKH